MTPEEKAKEILYKYARIVPGIDYGDLYECDWKTAKACAIEEVKAILYELEVYREAGDRWNNLQQVLTEIEKL